MKNIGKNLDSRLKIRCFFKTRIVQRFSKFFHQGIRVSRTQIPLAKSSRAGCIRVFSFLGSPIEGAFMDSFCLNAILRLSVFAESSAITQPHDLSAFNAPASSRGAMLDLMVMQLALGIGGGIVVAAQAMNRFRSASRSQDGKSRFVAALSAFGPFAAWLLLVLSAYELSGSTGITGVALDSSWPLVLEYAAQHHWQFGKDIIYTMGPLGYLYTDLGLGGFQWERVTFALSQALFSGYVSWQMGLAVPNRFLRAALWVLLVLLPPTPVLLCAGVAMLIARNVPRPAPIQYLETGGLCSACAIMALIKFTNLMAATLVLACVVLHCVLQRRARPAILVSLAFLMIFLFGWSASGQALSSLPAYLRNSWEISTGYVALSYPPSTGMLELGLAIAIGLLITATICLISFKEKKLRMLIAIAPVLGCAFLSWKHGFTRADGHELQFIASGFPFACLLATATFQERTPSGILRWPMLLTAIATIILVFSAFAVSGENKLTAAHIRSHLLKIEKAPARIAHTFAPSFQLPRIGDTGSRAMDEWKLPEINRLVGQSTVDIFNYQQAYAFINGFNYLPRPVFQSYSSYTPRLQRLNLEHFHDGNSAKFLLFRPETIDTRLSWIDDGPLLLTLLTDCEPLVREKGFLLLRRRNEGASSGIWKDIASGTTSWGRKVELLPPSGSRTLRALRVDAPRSLAGKLRQFGYQGSNVQMIQKLDDGSKITRTLVPEMAAEGFLISPSLRSLADVLGWQTGLLAAKNVTSCTLSLPEESKWQFKKKFGYVLSEWMPNDSPHALDPGQAAKFKGMLFPYLPAAPQQSQPPLEDRVLNGLEAGTARAPTRLEFVVPANATGLAGRIAAECADGDKPPESVTFRATLLDAEGKEIWRHETIYTPKLHREDEGAHQWNLDFPGNTNGAARQLVLESSTTKTHNRALTWWGPLAWKNGP